MTVTPIVINHTQPALFRLFIKMLNTAVSYNHEQQGNNHDRGTATKLITLNQDKKLIQDAWSRTLSYNKVINYLQ